MDVELVARIVRFILVGANFLAFRFFFLRYRTEKDEEKSSASQFYLGFSIFFLFFTGMNVGVAIYDILTDYISGLSDVIRAQFPGYEVPGALDSVGIFWNVLRPIYILGFVAALVATAALIYPLETVIGWRKTPSTILLLAICPFLLLIFIPGLTYTLYSPIVLGICYGGIAYGLVLNVIVNIWLAKRFPGKIRRRSLMIIVAFSVFYFGFIWALETGISEAIYESWGYNHDVLFGSLLEILGCFLYWRGFALRGDSSQSREINPNSTPIREGDRY